MTPSRKQLDYAKALAVIGQFAAKQGLSDICVMEFEEGMILIGSTIYETGEILNRQTVSHIFSVDDLQKMIRGG
ncbi:MAG: hypothetical protein HZB51_25930 [Chloroflexi bacterium]|nr:hypothetical protein [Chloroflexota bacterium]